MSKWILPIMGFTETKALPTGIERIWRELKPLDGGNISVCDPFEWDDDVSGFARFMRRNSTGDCELLAFAYSWGCGQAFCTLAEECEALGITIRVALLCDPVYRSRLFPVWLPFNPLSLTALPTIRIPASVERVEWVRQVKDWPRGHNPAAKNPDLTHIGNGRYLEYTHGTIDDSPHFREMVYQEAVNFVHQPAEHTHP